MKNDRSSRTLEMTESQRGERLDKHLLEKEGYGSSRGTTTLDVNLYATKKSVAQGLMDIALLTANAAQLRFILREGDDNRFYLLNVICIGFSIAFQLAVGVLLILNTRYNINFVRDQQRAEFINNITIIGIFLICVTNVFVSAFGSTPK